MRPWTTRTMQAAVVAAGFAAVGTASASAEEASPLPAPDLSQVPDEVGFSVPVDACEMQQGAAFHRTKAPCVDAQVKASSPNLVKQVGADIVTTTHGVAGELRDGRPILAPGKPNRILGHLFAETTRVEQMTKARPTISADVQPDHTGAFDQHAKEGGFFEAKIGPRQPDHEGVSAVDTAAEFTAAQGYELEPLANPVGAVAPTLRDTPQNGSGPTLPKLGHVAPIANDMPALAMVDNKLADATHKLGRDVATGLPKLPPSKGLDSVPGAGLVEHILG
ncbi:hypothetical protein [Parasphingorhabdus pacifica]